MDRYQGQQNDYIILSLVRTKTIGHLRDVRRLVVAMSRARLGLYILARANLFRNCFELSPAFDQVGMNESTSSALCLSQTPNHVLVAEGGGVSRVEDFPLGFSSGTLVSSHREY